MLIVMTLCIVAISTLKSRKTEICCTRFLYLICCTRYMIDGLINIKKIRYKTLLLTFVKRIHSYKINISIALFLAMQCPVFLAMKYGQSTHTSCWESSLRKVAIRVVSKVIKLTCLIQFLLFRKFVAVLIISFFQPFRSDKFT